MKRIATITVLWLMAVVVHAIDIVPLPADSLTLEIDMRQGLSESRVRVLTPLPGMLMAIATAGYLDIYDGVRFVSAPVTAAGGVELGSRRRYGRRLMPDGQGRMWVKTGVIKPDDRARLYAFDIATGADVTDSAMPKLAGAVIDYYVDEAGRHWAVDSLRIMRRVDHGAAPVEIDLTRFDSDVPDMVVAPGRRMMLCYASGKTCVVDIASGMVDYIGAPLGADGRVAASAAVAPKWHDGRLWRVYNRHDASHSVVAGLDTVNFQWTVVEVPEIVNDFTFDARGRIFTATGQIMAVAVDAADGMWIGTKESGLRYYNPHRRPAECFPEPYSHQRADDYVSSRAERLALRYAAGITNCTAEDSVDHYVYIGTRHGLIVIDSLDRRVARLDERDGMSHANVQSVIANVGRGSGAGSDVWLSTATGLSRVSRGGGDSLRVVNLGFIDGVRLDGREFSLKSISLDSLGRVVAGYSGGICVVDPAVVDNVPRAVFTYPRSDGDDGGAGSRMLPVVLILAGCAVVLIVAVGAIAIRRRRKAAVAAAPSRLEADMDYFGSKLVSDCQSAAPQPSDVADSEFLDRLRRVVDRHIGDETLNVLTLSRHMAMDRTSLYRRMQATTGTSPSVYIKSVRLAAASRLLRETDLPIAEVAQQTGFSSTKYFSAAFKEANGQLPVHYRRLHRP